MACGVFKAGNLTGRFNGRAKAHCRAHRLSVIIRHLTNREGLNMSLYRIIFAFLLLLSASLPVAAQDSNFPDRMSN